MIIIVVMEGLGAEKFKLSNTVCFNSLFSGNYKCLSYKVRNKRSHRFLVLQPREVFHKGSSGHSFNSGGGDPVTLSVKWNKYNYSFFID